MSVSDINLDFCGFQKIELLENYQKATQTTHAVELSF